LRAAVAAAERVTDDVPLAEVIRPFLSRGHVGLGCHHVAMSLAKTTPDKLVSSDFQPLALDAQRRRKAARNT
jgi:hypothetical protein